MDSEWQQNPRFRHKEILLVEFSCTILARLICNNDTKLDKQTGDIVDSISIITGALILGVAAGIKPTAEQAVKDAYNAFKSYLSNRYNIALNGIEDDPASKPQQAAVQETLHKKGAMNDPEVIRLSEVLLETTRKTRGEFKNIQEMINSDDGVQKSVTEANAQQTMVDSEGGQQIITKS